MTPEAQKVIDQAIEAAGSTCTLFVDDSSYSPQPPNTVFIFGGKGSELWLMQQHVSVAVISKSREPRELYRVLCLLERLVNPGGVILLPREVQSGDVTENRFEATEAFLGVYPNWTRCLRSGNVVQLKKQAENEIKIVTPVTVAVNQKSSVGKRVISLAIFGEGGYWAFLPSYVRAHHILFPGYELRIHHDEAIYWMPYGAELHGLQARGLVKLVYMPSHPGQGKCEKMLWRLAPAWDPEVEYVFARDVDGLPTWRERCATEEFIAAAQEGKVNLHSILDNVAHCGIMGGLCGAQASALRNLAPTFEDFIAAAGYTDADWAQHGADQNYLNSKVAPKLRVFEHALCMFKGEDGQESHKRSKPTTENAAMFGTEIAPFDDERVPLVAKQMSDSLIPYMGVAGCSIDRAMAFYSNFDMKSFVDAEGEVPQAAKGRKFAVISADTNETYSFFSPLTARMWLRRGFCPFVILIGEAKDWLASSRGRLVVEETRRTGAIIHFAGDFPSHRSATAAQLSRLYAASASGVREDDYFLTSDVDMWPLGNWVGSANVDEGDVHVYHSDAYAGQKEPQYPMCYVGAKASVWRRLLGQASSLHNAVADLGLLLFDEASKSWAPEEVKERAWDCDERIVGRAVANFHGDVRKAPRLMTVVGQWRLDRSNWQILTSLSGYADAHLPRPGFGVGWVKIRPLLELLGDFDLAWADEYHRAWLAGQ